MKVAATVVFAGVRAVVLAVVCQVVTSVRLTAVWTGISALEPTVAPVPERRWVPNSSHRRSVG